MSGRRWDLHFHTRWSDGRASAVDALARARALDIGFAVTDHNVIDGALRAWSLAGDEAPRRVVPGIEITTLERVHLLIYFRRPEALLRFYERSVGPWRPRGATATTVLPRSAADLLQDLRRYDHVTSAAHPFALAKNGWLNARAQYGHLAAMLSDLDALEVLNGEELDAANARAMDLSAASPKLGATVGSDGHTLGELGNVTLELPVGADLFEVVRASAGAVRDERPPGAWRSAATHVAKVPYFAARPFRFAYRYALRVDELQLETEVPRDPEPR